MEEALIDAYGESEQRTAFLTMLEEHLACPFTTEVLGRPVHVDRVDLDDTDEIVAVCRRGRTRFSTCHCPYDRRRDGSGLPRIDIGLAASANVERTAGSKPQPL